MTDKGNHASTGDKSKPSMGRFVGSFQRQVVDKAERVFCSVDDKLNPSAFLVGIPADQSAESTLVTLEQADDSGYQPEFFSGVMELANQLDQEKKQNALLGPLRQRMIRSERFLARQSSAPSSKSSPNPMAGVVLSPTAHSQPPSASTKSAVFSNSTPKLSIHTIH